MTAWMLAAGKPSTGIGVVLGALAMVALAVFVWAVAIRKPDDSRHHRHHWRQRRDRKSEGADSEEKEFSGSRRRRRRRRKHRPMNPTLSETGGLPPKRPQDEPPRGI